MTFRRLSRRINSDVLPENIFPIIIDNPISADYYNIVFFIWVKFTRLPSMGTQDTIILGRAVSALENVSIRALVRP